MGWLCIEVFNEFGNCLGVDDFKVFVLIII